MREILFRGQTRRYGEKVRLNGEKIKSNWVYGGIFPQNKGGDFAIIYQQEPTIKKYPFTQIQSDSTQVCSIRMARKFLRAIFVIFVIQTVDLLIMKFCGLVENG